MTSGGKLEVPQEGAEADKMAETGTGTAEEVAGLLALFHDLTPKQHEVMRRVAENRTSKEIAWDLGVSESAINQRIEAVRSRGGGALRAELARAYRQYLEEQHYKPVTGNILQISALPGTGQSMRRDEPADALALADAVVYTVTPPWQGEAAFRIEDGRPVRMLTVIDEYTRECLAIRTARRIRSDDVIHALTELI